MSAEMTRRNFIGVAAATTAAALAACANGTPEPASEGAEPGPASEGETAPEVENPADLVLKNAAVYTVDDAWTVASAVAVKGDTIIAVGSDAGLHRPRHERDGPRRHDGHAGLHERSRPHRGKAQRLLRYVPA